MPTRPTADYPDAERLDLVEEIHGHQIADPYRWLEDFDDPWTRDWCAQQDELFARWQRHWLGDEASGQLRRRLAALADAGSVSAPVWRGERQFFTRRAPGQEHEVLLTVGPDDAERALIDPAALDPSGSTTLDAWFPSQEGQLLAYLVSSGGTEQSLLRVMNVATGEIVDGPIEETSHSPVAWLPGGTAFYYGRRPAPDQAPGGPVRLNRPVYLHRVGTDPDRDVLLHAEGLPATGYFVPAVSRDGRWLRLDVDWGSLRVDTYLADIGACGIEAPRFAAFQQGVDAISAPSFGPDGRIYVLTDRAAQNRRLCVADPDLLDYEHWHTLLPEDPEAVLKDFAILDGTQLERPLLLALRSRHALSELTLHDLATGELVASVPAPGLGTIKELKVHPDGGPLAWFSYTAILYGYGSFGNSQTPAFSALRLAWVEAGGVYAIANVRGGGEEGQAWHHAGIRKNKQNTFDDFHAAGDYLVDQGWTTRPRLGIHGGSAGGQLVGVALTQRPDAYAAVLCSAPLLDMVRHELFGLGALTILEYGSAREPEQLAWLLEQSPYHHVRLDTAYPATLFTVFEGDSRVDTLHARKLAAALQYATSAPAGDRPILLRREHNVGHTARAVSRSIPLWLDQLGFFARQLGLGSADCGRRWPATHR